MNYSTVNTSEINRPVSHLFIALTFLAAFILNLLPWSGYWLLLKPDFTAVVLLYWCMHSPTRVGIGLGWLLGMLTDISTTTTFGQHALCYTLLAYCGQMLHRRFRIYNIRQQITQVFVIFAGMYLIYLTIQWISGHQVIWLYLAGSLSSALLWVPLSMLLNYSERFRPISPHS